MDGFGGGFGRNRDNGTPNKDTKEYADEKYDCLTIKQVVESSKLITSDNDKFTIDGTEVGHPIIVARCVDVKTESTRIEYIWEDFTGQVKTLINVSFEGNTPKFLEGVTVDCGMWFRVQLSIKFYKNVIFSVVKVEPIEDVGQITQHLLLATISHYSRKHGNLAVVSNEEEIQNTNHRNYKSAEEFLRAEVESRPRDKQAIINIVKKNFSDETDQSVKNLIGRMIDQGKIMQDHEGNLSIL